MGVSSTYSSVSLKGMCQHGLAQLTFGANSIKVVVFTSSMTIPILSKLKCLHPPIMATIVVLVHLRNKNLIYAKKSFAFPISVWCMTLCGLRASIALSPHLIILVCTFAYLVHHLSSLSLQVCGLATPRLGIRALRVFSIASLQSFSLSKPRTLVPKRRRVVWYNLWWNLPLHFCRNGMLFITIF